MKVHFDKPANHNTNSKLLESSVTSLISSDRVLRLCIISFYEVIDLGPTATLSGWGGSYSYLLTPDSAIREDGKSEKFR